ncbi:MAG: hypothetical protein ABJB12_24150, partial [Pseudomonadota bacterium]
TATRVGQLKGKIAYMAPEQAAGEESLDRRADVFASGIVIWEQIAAKRLFKAENEAATLSRVMTEPVPQLSTIVPSLSAELSKVIMRALERNPDQRFASCAQFADALEAAATGRDGIATPRELAAYVTEVLGEEVSAQREAVRAWIARSEPSQAAVLGGATRSSSVSAAAMSFPGPDHSQAATLTESSPPPGRSRVGVVLLVAVLLVGVAYGSFVVARRTSPQPPAAALPLPAASPIAASPPPPAPAPEPAASDPSMMPLEVPTSAKPAVAQQRPRAAVKIGTVDPGAAKKPKKRADDDVDMRNPYR